MQSRDIQQKGFFHERVFFHICKEEIIDLFRDYTQVKDVESKAHIIASLGQKLKYAITACENLKLELDSLEGQGAQGSYKFIEKRLVFRDLAGFLTSIKHIAAELDIVVPTFYEALSPQPSSVIDTSVIDTSVIDTSVIDTSVIDSSVIDASVIDEQVSPINTEHDQVIVIENPVPEIEATIPNIPSDITPLPTSWGDKTVADLVLLMDRTDALHSIAKALGMQANTLEGILCTFPLNFRKLKSVLGKADETDKVQLMANIPDNVPLKDLIRYWEKKTVGDLFREIKTHKISEVLDYLKMNNAKTLKTLLGKITGSDERVGMDFNELKLFLNTQDVAILGIDLATPLSEFNTTVRLYDYPRERIYRSVLASESLQQAAHRLGVKYEALRSYLKAQYINEEGVSEMPKKMDIRFYKKKYQHG